MTRYWNDSLYLQEDELAHHGVLGMHWGVRRYQNADGSYTKAGLKRYNASMDKYESSKRTRDAYKAASKGKPYYDSSTDTKYEMSLSKADKKKAKQLYRTAKYETKKAKQQVKKDYNHLKEDYRADKGKQLYSEGYRIRSNLGTKLIKGATTVGGAAYTAYMMDLVGNKAATAIIAGSAAVGAVGSGVALYNKHKDRNLRSYYQHTSNY